MVLNYWPLFLLSILSYSSSIGIPLNAGSVLGTLRHFAVSINEEIKFRKSSLEQYQTQIQSRIRTNIELFRKDQKKVISDAQKEIEAYTQKFNIVYEEAIVSLNKQRDSLNELNKKYVRADRIDESLDSFRRFYNDTITQSVIESSRSGNIKTKAKSWRQRRKERRQSSGNAKQQLENAILQQRKTYSKEWLKLDAIFMPKADGTPWDVQLERWNQSFYERWDKFRSFTEEGAMNTESLKDRSLKDLTKLQEDLYARATALSNDVTQSLLLPTPTATSSSARAAALTKADLRSTRAMLEEQLEKLERERSQWVEERKLQLESSLKSLQVRIKDRDSLLQDLLGQRRVAVQYTAVNDATLNKIISMMDEKADGWQLVKEEDGIKVYRKFMTPGTPGARFACVKSYGVIEAEPKKVFEVFEDDSRIGEYNSLYKSGRNIEIVGADTKIAHTFSHPIFPFKARDFCTLFHYRKLKDGTMIMLNSALQHPEARSDAGYVRGSIVLGASIVQPIPGRPKYCKLTMITQVDPGGIIPPVLMNTLCTSGPIGFVKNVEIAANRPKPRR